MSAKTWLDFLPQPSPDMLKRTYYTEITPLPASVGRGTAIAWLHDHVKMIRVNPLVIKHSRCTAPPNATKDEADLMAWYQITDEIKYIPGTAAKTQVTYKAGFYDVPTGIQTRVFSPGGVDLISKWSVGGSMPGEAKEPVELGLEKPKNGLYLREEVELRCNVLLTSFVKRNMKKAHVVMVQNLINDTSPARASDEHLDRLATFKSTASDRTTGVRSSMQIASPANSNTWPTSSASPESNNAGPSTFRRSGTECTCPGPNHVISCPNYTRIYKPPVLYAQPGHTGNAEETRPGYAAYPTPQPQSAAAHSPARSWATTPSTYQGEDVPIAYLRDMDVVHQPHMSSAPAVSFERQPGEPQAALSSVVYSNERGTGRDATLSENSLDQLDRATDDMAVELGSDPESAKFYYEYQARRAELE